LTQTLPLTQLISLNSGIRTFLGKIFKKVEPFYFLKVGVKIFNPFSGVFSQVWKLKRFSSLVKFLFLFNWILKLYWKTEKLKNRHNWEDFIVIICTIQFIFA
jgi:hypothetical protein